MSGYDFAAGFFGSLGQQMQQKQQQKIAAEEEERQYQRALSREEALAKSRERMAIAAEERRMRAQPPEMQQYTDEATGKTMQALRRFDPQTQKFVTFGKATEVQPSVARTVDIDGQLTDIMTNGTRVVLGESASGRRTRSANDRAREALASKPPKAPPKDPLAGEVRREIRAVMRDWADEAKRNNWFETYGINPKTGTREQLSQAVENSIRGIKPESSAEVSSDPELVKKYSQVLANKIAEQNGEAPKAPNPEPSENYTEFANDIASARKRYAGGNDATEDEIIEALIYEGKLRRNSDGRLSKN